MKVTLVSYTQDALELLIFSKKTRLLNSVADYDAVKRMNDEQKKKELEYVFGTIGSSLEFVDYVFLIEGVSRGFTHQLVRHRVGTSFAQQTMRTVDFSQGFEYLSTGICEKLVEYKEGMDSIKESYEKCISKGAHPQDARGLLPTNILTNILFKANLRTLNGIMNTRLCFKVQGEFQRVAKAIKQEAEKVHPWIAPVMQAHCCQHGICAFPGYKLCPVRPYLPDINLKAIQERHASVEHEARPKMDVAEYNREENK